MDRQHPFTTTEEERSRRRAQRIAARKARERKRRRRMLKRLVPVACLALVLLSGVFVLKKLDGGQGDAKASDLQGENGQPAELSGESVLEAMLPQPELDPLPVPEPTIYSAEITADTKTLGTEINSEYAVVVDAANQTILAEKNADAVINPASMTKVLTVLVASEHLKSQESLKDTVTIDFSITDYCYVNDCSVVGFLVDEEVTVKDLFYGTILPSGADAAVGLANYIAGSQEAFVELMKEKLEELGLSDTAHFTNCVGLYDENHYCTVYDMAMILKAAMDDPLCREVISTKVHYTEPSNLHPEGMVLSNWFMRRIEDKDSGAATVLGGKTGYVNESGNCAASCAEDGAGNLYICVTGKAGSSSLCMADHVALYTSYVK